MNCGGTIRPRAFSGTKTRLSGQTGSTESEWKTYETQSTSCPHVWEPRARIKSGERCRHCAFRPIGGAALSTGFHSPPWRSHRVERREATGDSVPNGESEGTLSRA